MATGQPDGAESDDAERGRELLAIASRLLDGSAIADERDVIQTSVVQVLSSGPLNTASILAGLNELWPGSDVHVDLLASTLEVATRSGLVVKVASAEPTWTLTQTAIEENRAAELWYRDAMARFSEEIRERADDDTEPISVETADLWANLLLAALVKGIAEQGDSHLGRVRLGASGEIRPIGLNGYSVLDAIRMTEASQTHGEFLAGCAAAAIDEADPFANEIVNYIATGCVLHAVASRRMGAEDRATLGSLEGRRLLVDTNVLFFLLGPRAIADPLRAILRRAVEAQMEVIVPEHVLAELNDVVQRVTARYIPDLKAALRMHISTEVYMQTVSEETLSDFLAAAKEGLYKTWEDYQARVAGLRGELGDLGVEVRDHNNRDQARAERASGRLATEIERSGGSRGQAAIERDGQTIEMVWRVRRSTDEREGLWPAGWILSTDSKINPTYASLDRLDSVPIALRPAHLATLLAQTAPEPEVPALVEAASSFVRHDALVTMATRFPPATALSLAKGLAGENFSTTDARVASLNLTGLLDLVADDSQPTGAQITSYVVAKRAQRTAAAQNRQRELLRGQSARLERARDNSRARVSVERSARIAAERESSGDKAELKKLRAEVAERPTVVRRTAIVAGLVVIGLVGAAVAAVLGWWWLFGGTLLGVVVLLNRARKWVSDTKTRWWVLLLALVPELVVIVDLFRSFG
jgi:predicted nucleic acid-binding protein